MGFTEITGPEYTESLRKRVRGEVPEYNWLKQFRNILRANLRPGITLLDIGCATGYAYNSFREFGVVYLGLDFEAEYIKIASEWFADTPEAKFIQYDITASPPPQTAEIVICSATFEHLPHLMPALQHLVDGAERIIVLRTFLGDIEHIYDVPSLIPNYESTHRKYYNQFSFKDVLGYIEGRGFKARVYRDEHTDSMPQFLEGIVRRCYIVYAEKT